MESKSNLPWQDLIRFHSEVLRRGERAFYSLPDTENGRDRWGELSSFHPVTLAGPWTISMDDITHDAFVRRIKNEEVNELYIGGPCWHRYQYYGRTQYTAWSPLLCREVSLEFTEDRDILVEPQQGAWDVAPPVFSLLERLSIQPQEELDTLIPQLIEDAYSLSQAEAEIDLTDHFKTLISRHIPELGERLDEDPDPNMADPLRSEWILFVPPAGVSVYTRYLMRDYQMLKRRLAEDENSIGGLKLLDPVIHQVDSSREAASVLPIVPLNDEQERAVGDILGDKPVSVVSGPPGCGKSQVVVSAILNAWANGKRVLFASTTNKAVEVVKERLKTFEQEVPIAVRAGSKRFNNVEDSLQRVLRLASFNRDRLKELKPDSGKEDLLARESELESALDSNLPQRINESLRSSIRAYGKCQELRGKVAKEEEEFHSRIKDRGLECEPSRLENDVLEPLRQWLDDKADVRAAITQDEKEAQSLDEEIQSAQGRRNRFVESIGLNAATVDDWKWLEQGPSPELLENWFEEYKAFLQEPIERELQSIDWDEEYNIWNGSNDARRWLRKARDLNERIRSQVRELREDVHKVCSIRDERKELLQRLREFGLSEHQSFDHSVISEWNADYAEFCSMSDSIWDWLPWSKKSTLRRQLRQHENLLRAKLPVRLWRHLGELDDGGRDRLSEALEEVDAYLRVDSIWDDLSDKRERIKRAQRALQRDTNQVRGVTFPDSWRDLDLWLEVAEKIQRMSTVAEAAEKAWKKRERKQEVKKSLSALVDRFNSIASGVPVKEAWVQGKGSVFAASVRQLGSESAPETVASARSHVYTAPLSELTSYWKQARSEQTKISELRQSKMAIPSESERIRNWYDKAPSFVDLSRSTYEVLPSDDDQLVQFRNEVRHIVDEWTEFVKEIRPSLRTKADAELQWAKEHLEQTIQLIPEDFPDRDRAKKLVRKLVKENKTWPTARLVETFKAFNPERLRGEITSIRHKLTQISFHEAQYRWLERLQENPDTQRAVQELLTHFNRNNGYVGEEAYPAFRKALDALPICLLNAHGPQYVPVDENLFDVLIIDEATQCTLTNLLPLIYRAEQLAVIGDPDQLPAIPTITASAEKQLAEKFGVEEWLTSLGHAENDVYSASVSCLPRSRGDVINLVDHYRSHPLIIGFSNREVYQKQLRLRRGTDDFRLGSESGGVFGHHISGNCTRGTNGRSWKNEAECIEVIRIIQRMKRKDEFSRLSIGVVTPFRAQKELYLEKLEDRELLRNVTADTAYGFQGDERDVMIFSPVISSGIPESTARWVETPHNQINVSVTRGREALFVVGDFKVCRQRGGILGALIRFVEDVQELRQTSVYELQLFSRLVTEGLDPDVHPHIGDIEVDFILSNPAKGVKLVVEVDGSQHDNQKHQDQSRDAFLQSRGYKVHRVATRSIQETPVDVIHQIEDSLELR